MPDNDVRRQLPHAERPQEYHVHNLQAGQSKAKHASSLVRVQRHLTLLPPSAFRDCPLATQFHKCSLVHCLHDNRKASSPAHRDHPPLKPPSSSRPMPNRLLVWPSADINVARLSSRPSSSSTHWLSESPVLYPLSISRASKQQHFFVITHASLVTHCQKASPSANLPAPGLEHARIHQNSIPTLDDTLCTPANV